MLCLIWLRTATFLNSGFSRGALERGMHRGGCWEGGGVRAGRLTYLRKIKLGGSKVLAVHPRRAAELLDRMTEQRLSAEQRRDREKKRRTEQLLVFVNKVWWSGTAVLQTRTQEDDPSSPTVPAAENQVRPLFVFVCAGGQSRVVACCLCHHELMSECSEGKVRFIVRYTPRNNLR